MSTINVHDLLTSLAASSEDQKAFRQAVLEWTGSPDSKKKSRKSKAKTTEDGEAKPKRQTAWNAWIEARCGTKDAKTPGYLEWANEQKENGEKPSPMAYASKCKNDDLDAYKEFESKFKSSASSAASAATHDSEDEAVAELEVKPAKKASKSKKSSAKSDASDAETAVVIEAKPAKKSAAKPKKAAKKVVESDSDSE